LWKQGKRFGIDKIGQTLSYVDAGFDVDRVVCGVRRELADEGAVPATDKTDS
jgi:hypothetical protein